MGTPVGEVAPQPIVPVSSGDRCNLVLRFHAHRPSFRPDRCERHSGSYRIGQDLALGPGAGTRNHPCRPGMADTPSSGGVRSPGEVGQPLPVRAFRFSILAKASSVRVNRWRSPARRQRSSTVRLRPEAFCAVQAAYNFACRLGTLNGLTPYEYICKIRASKPDRFISNPIHQMPGLNTW